MDQTKGKIIKKAINSCLDEGLTDKQDIYSKVVDDLMVPRPTVRRVARDLRHELLARLDEIRSSTAKQKTAMDLRDELLAKIKVLQSKVPKSA